MSKFRERLMAMVSLVVALMLAYLIAWWQVGTEDQVVFAIAVNRMLLLILLVEILSERQR